MTLPAFTKPIEQITLDDIANIVNEKYPENEVAEYKEKLPTKDGVAHPWYTGGTDIGDKARNEILAEVVAFANAHGGHLVLGIRESDEHPRHAAAIEHIPRCAELAERLKLQMRDCIEPQIPLVHVRGVSLEADGSGVVIIRVPESRAGPHRLKQTLECYFRRGDRCERMTMRDIQDLTLRLNRGLIEIEEKYKKRQQEFHAQLANKNKNTAGIRATLIPLAPLYIDRVIGDKRAFIPWRYLSLSINKTTHKLEFPSLGYSERPILRGAERRQDDNKFQLVQQVYNDGLIELQVCHELLDENPYTWIEWILVVAGNGLLMTHAFRQAAGAPEMEYGLELEIVNPRGHVIIGNFNGAFSLVLGDPIESPCIFPRYSFGPLSELGKLIEEICKDICNAAGVHAPQGPYCLSWQG